MYKPSLVYRTVVWVFNSRDVQPRPSRIILSGEMVLRVGSLVLAGRCRVESSVVAVGERGRYWTCIYIGPPQFLCLAMMCRIVWPTGACTAVPLFDWRGGNGGQYAQTQTVGIIRVVTLLF